MTFTCILIIFFSKVLQCTDLLYLISGRDDAFYLTPLQKYHDKIWFSRQPVGHNTLQKLIPTACSEAGIKGHRTNHSLRATAATALYKAGIDEQLIMEQTGHVSLSGQYFLSGLICPNV